jgi:hypothetical protein
MGGNALKIASEYLKTDRLIEPANYLLSKVTKVHLNYDDARSVKPESLENFGFSSREAFIDRNCTEVNAILGDTEISPNSTIRFLRVIDNPLENSIVSSDHKLASLLNKLPVKDGKKIGKLGYDVEKQYVILGNVPLYAIITEDKDGHIDGVLFAIELGESEAETHHTISYPGGQREGITKKIPIVIVNSVHLLGIAETDGPLGSGEITLEEYFQRIEDKDAFKNSKRYYMGVKLDTQFPLMCSLLQ